jgi:pimeloyl-ACP methyl ester carboxylesterase
MKFRFFLAALFLLIPAVNSFALTEIRTIPTRPGVTMDFLMMTPDRLHQRDALIFFPGGNGAGPFRLTGGIVNGWSFLVRSADSFVRDGVSVITVNPPSDHSTGMSTGFRESAEHAEDIAKLAVYLEQQGFQRIFLVGNSRGTLSAASIGARLKDSRFKGVILTSSLEYDNFLRWLPLEKLELPVLMVHHRDDACRVSPFQEAERTRDSLRSHTRVDFTEVSGGAYPRSAPCDNLSAHGFFGIEEKVVQVITDWVDGRAVPERIE